MLTDIEMLKIQLDAHKEESQSLKDKHEWGDWENWRTFTKLDIKANEYKIKLLLKENKNLMQALNDYKDY